MINGSALAPFRHDSTWHDVALRLFRSAVYYVHVLVPGRDPLSHAREVALFQLREAKRRQETPPPLWEHVKDACDKGVHLRIKGVNDDEMSVLVKNILIFVNLLLIADYGFAEAASVRFEFGDTDRTKQYEADSEVAHQKTLEEINRAFESMTDAIEALRQSNGKLRGSLDLQGASVLSPIKNYVHVVDAGDDDESRIVVVLRDRDADICDYQFRPHDPIGWVMMNGNPTEDRFADDAMSSKWRRPLFQ